MTLRDPIYGNLATLITDLLSAYAAIAVARGAQPGDRVSRFFSPSELRMIEEDVLKRIFGNPPLDPVLGMVVSAVYS
jgi:hypothetical protein